MDNAKNQLAEKLKTANYVLVTVSHDPSVDQLAALIGLTLLLNKTGKHAAAVFSGQIPSTLDFLKPEDTIEQTTDSLRDFIIALDKSKADKLRYKVEDDLVRIFITPYKTSITQDDLQFSQGDFNVDVVVALGVTQQGDLDQAIVEHGRILHDATVATVNLSAEGDFGSIHWQNPKASSLSEMVTSLGQALDADLIDNQIATALLTGIVAETERFSNEKTTAEVMTISAALMAAGANQQLVATQLAQPKSDTEQVNAEWTPDAIGATDETPTETEVDTPETPETPEISSDESSMEINHEDEVEAEAGAEEAFSLPEPEAVVPAEPATPLEHLSGGSKLITEPPTLGGQLTANSQVEPLEQSSDPLSQPPGNQDALLSRAEPLTPTPQAPEEEAPAPAAPNQVITGLTPPPPAWVPPMPVEPAQPEAPQTLTDLESAVHDDTQPTVGLDAARDEVLKALSSDPNPALEPVQALNAQPMADSLNASPPTPPEAPAELTPETAELNALPSDIPALPLPGAAPADAGSVAFDPAAFGITTEPGTPVPGTATPTVSDPNAAPPVPPPIPFNFGTPPPPPTPPEK